MKIRRALVALAVALAPGALAGQEFQVNTYTTSDQKQPAVATDPKGRFLVAWSSDGSAGADHDDESVQLRELKQFVASPAPELEVNTTFTGPQGDPAIAVGRDGSFVVAWADYQVDGDYQAVQARRYTSLGLPMGVNFQVNTLTEGAQFRPDIAVLEDGGFVIVWTSSISSGDDDDGFSIQSRRYDAAGVAQGAEAQVNVHTPAHQASPAVSAIAGGGWVVAWESEGVPPSPSGYQVYARRYAADGDSPGGDFLVNSAAGYGSKYPDVASLAGGSFLVVWGGDELLGRRYSAAAAPLDPPFPIHVATTGLKTYPRIAADPLGGYLVTWSNSDTPSDESYGIRARFLDSGDDGSSEFPVNAFTTGVQDLPDVAMDADGDVLISWSSDPSPAGEAGEGIRGRRLSSPFQAAHWRLDEGSGASVFDSAAGVNDDGTALGPTWVAGRHGAALSFDGLDDFVSLVSSADLEQLGSFGTTVSLSAWVRLDLLPSQLPGSFASIFDSTIDNYVLYLDRTNAELRFKATDQNGAAYRPGIPESALTAGRWHHVTGVYDGPGLEARIYLDGVLHDTEVLPAVVPVRSSPAQVPAIGRNGQNAEYFFPGDIDDLIVWRSALTAEDLAIFEFALFADGFESGNSYAWSLDTP